VSSPPSLTARLVSLCADRAWIVVLLALALATTATTYVLGHFAMSSNTYDLLSPKLPWRLRETEFNTLFPQAGPKIVVVVDGQTPELTEAATTSLAQLLRTEHRLFRSVHRPDSGPFWARNGLLYAPTQEVQATMAQLIKVEPFLGPMAADPSLRGLMGALSTALQGVNSGQTSLENILGPIRRLAEALESLRSDDKRAYFSWRNLISGSAPDEQELRHLILVDPHLEFSQLQPGEVPIAAIRTAARALRLDAAHGVSVRITGPVALQDEEFATLAERAPLIAALAIAAISMMLWMAVRSIWLIVAILGTTLVGLVSAAALGLGIFHRFNVISVAFIPLFVGLGIDLGIQFSVRYRAERGTQKDVRAALVATGQVMGRSLTLAAAAIAAGFLAFAPTAYYGLSQLGVIAGFGMFIALTLNLTLLPALIQLSKPGARAGATSARLVLVDNFVLRQRVTVVCIGVVLGVVSAALLPWLHFDFNPLHLRSSKVESVATLYDLTNDPQRSPNTLEAIYPNLARADQLAARVRVLPEVSLARTLSSFVPDDQAERISIIADAANLLDLPLNPVFVAPPPNDAQVIDSLLETSTQLRQAASRDPEAGANAARLADDLRDLAKAQPSMRTRAAEMLLPGLATVLEQVRESLHPQSITITTLPPELVRGWLTPDGRARLSITPKGDANENGVLTRFIAAVIREVPDATGTALSIREAGRAVVSAFAEAGVLSFVAITGLLLVTLRRVRDVAITMAPIVLTGLLTMGSCVVVGQPLNFANIIALPLLFGIGVAFHIYFVMAWRAGGAHLLTSSLARGVFFSALATATGFGSLWASSHPGTASMGKLLMISLVWTLVSALLFQPALMGISPAARASRR
jgi:hopanoid biosynthesis associated RND transporter like protein HpnN